MMYRGTGNRNRGQIGRSPPRRKRTPEGENKFCIHCKVQLSSGRLFEEHKNSAVHKQKEILIGKAISDGLQYCYTCEKIFPSKLALDAHCLMTRHKPLYRVDELQELISKTPNGNNLIVAPRPPESRREREEKEREDIVMKLKEVRGGDESKEINTPNKNDIIDKSSSTEIRNFFCDVCNVDCMNSSNYRIHTESWRHRSEFDKKKEEKEKFDAEAELQFNAAEEIERKKVPEHLTGKAGFFCEVCSIASVNESAYLDHLKNRKHFRQVGQMRRPYKCYFCDVEFNVAKDFNYHLESRGHMDKAFNKDNRSKKRTKDDEWVEKKSDRREHREKETNRDARKDDRSRNRNHHKEKEDHKDHRSRESREGKKDSRRAELKEPAPKPSDGRRVEIVDVDSPSDTGIKDLREKLQGHKNIIITKSNSPEREEAEEKMEENPPPVDDQVNRARLEEVEKEFDVKFDVLMKKYDNDHTGLQDQLARDREEDINAYQKYEDSFKELKEEEDFIRGNIDKLEDNDPCKQDFIIDIIRVQRKMEEVRLQLEIKEVTIIKRENSYRQFFPEKEDRTECPVAEQKESNYMFDYDNEEEKEEINPVQNVESRVSPEKNSEPSVPTDLRVKLERERLVKRLGPELESVDPTLREKLLAVILEKEKDVDKTPKETTSGDTRQVVKDKDDNQMEQLAKREKQLETELANLKSEEKKKKKVPATKSLVPQYDDVDDKKKETKKKVRKRSVSSSSSSRSSSSSSDSSYYRNKKKRKSSPLKSRPKPKRSTSIEKVRKRRSRSPSRDRDKRKRTIVKKARDDDKKKRNERMRSEKKRSSKTSSKPPVKGSKSVKSIEDDDSDVQEVTPITGVQTISVIGSSSTVPTMNMPTPNVVIPVGVQPIHQPASVPSSLPIHHQPAVPSSLPQQRREQFSFWKSAQSAPSRESPKEDIWETAFSGGHQETSTSSATLNLFNPHGGAQLPEDILNILKSVAPIIQQNQNQNPYKQHPGRLSTANTQPIISNPQKTEPARPEISRTIPAQPSEQVTQGEKVDSTTRIRSILKKATEYLPPRIPPEESLKMNQQLPVIPGLDVPASMENVPPVSSPTEPHVSRSISNPPEHNTRKPYYSNNGSYLSSDRNAVHNPVSGHDPYDDYNREPLKTQSYDRNDPYAERDIDRKEEAPQFDNVTDYRRNTVPPNTERLEKYNDSDNYRQPQVGRDRPYPTERNRVVSPPRYEERPSTGVPTSPPENIGAYNRDMNIRPPERDPYLRSEVTHRVIDYSYVRDTRVIENHTPSRYNDNNPRQPVRYPGETDEEYYTRFERFYEINRRKEEKHTESIPTRRIVDNGLPNPDTRVPPSRGDYYTSKERYEDRSIRPPATDIYERSRGPVEHDRVPPMGVRVIDESVRKIDRVPPPSEERGATGRPSPYQGFGLTKRVEDITVRETHSSEQPYQSYLRNDYPPRDTHRDLPRFAPPGHAPPRLPSQGLPHAQLPRAAPITSDYDRKFQDY